jgi:two-component system, chemotaxis family, protein-glutamate methylesterase/glutaminase
MSEIKEPQKVIVVGTSKGGLAALRTLVGGLEATLPAAVLIVQHQAPDSPGLMADILTSAGPLPANYAIDGEPLLARRIYLASPNHHLLVEDSCVRVLAGPRENRVRPAIDPLFRSAAVYHNSRTIGVLLTGLLDDGSSGLQAVQRCGGVTIVQEPKEAIYTDMVTNAMALIKVDYVLPLVEIAKLLNRLASTPTEAAAPVPEDLRLEVTFSQRAMGGVEVMSRLGKGTTFTCPDCGGRLWEIDSENQLRYRCEVGHAFNGNNMVNGNREAVEEALWVALRNLQERERMLERLAASAEANGYNKGMADYSEKAAETKSHTAHLRRFLLDWTQTATEQT